NAASSAGQGQRATEATMPTRIAAKPSQSANLPGRSASTANSKNARPNQVHETSEPSFIIGVISGHVQGASAESLAMIGRTGNSAGVQRFRRGSFRLSAAPRNDNGNQTQPLSSRMAS